MVVGSRDRSTYTELTHNDKCMQAAELEPEDSEPTTRLPSARRGPGCEDDMSGGVVCVVGARRGPQKVTHQTMPSTC